MNLDAIQAVAKAVAPHFTWRAFHVPDMGVDAEGEPLGPGVSIIATTHVDGDPRTHYSKASVFTDDPDSIPTTVWSYKIEQVAMSLTEWLNNLDTPGNTEERQS